MPTPRGGGLAIALVFFLVLVWQFWVGSLKWADFIALGLGLMVAAIGFWDDHQHVPARWRFAVHLITAVAAVYGLNGLPLLAIGPISLNLGLLGDMVAVLGLVWLLNLYNFMDGIDGIAASEAIFVSAALAWFLCDLDPHLSVMALSLALASAGFLLWNWPPAKIFMGDVGSGFLGFVLGVLILMSTQLSANLLFVGLILLAVFISDATVTLIRRYLSGQKWYLAHCSHAYQHAARQYGHLKTLLAVAGINVFWLLPLAFLAAKFPVFNVAALSMAYLPLGILAVKFNAGKS
jgi:Fuc2NAc and GlcNAc transferase